MIDLRRSQHGRNLGALAVDLLALFGRSADDVNAHAAALALADALNRFAVHFPVR